MIDNKAFYKLSYGLYIVSSVSEGRKNGQIANTVFQITSDPITIAVSINKQNLTHEYIRKSKLIGISVLSEEAPMDLIGRFGFKSGRDIDKFSNVSFKTLDSGVPVVLDNTVSYFELHVEKEIDVLTHTVFICKVLSSGLIKDTNQMTYQYYQDIKRGKIQKTAPTYVENKEKPVSEISNDKPKYQCSVCGYIYDPDVGDSKSGVSAGTSFENLPDNWACPICGVSKDKFNQIN